MNGKDISQLLAFYNLLKLSGDTNSFRLWLKNYHKIENDEPLLRGYRFFFGVLVRHLIRTIMYNSSLGIGEDDVYHRACREDVPIKDVPNSCDKAILVKNIWSLSGPIRSAKDWESLTSAISEFDDQVISRFGEIYRRRSKISDKIGLAEDEALRILAMEHAFIFLNDTNRGVPWVYWVQTLPNMLTSDEMQNNFEGYKYSLQFVWYKLLGDDFKKFKIKDLHIIEKIVKKEYVDDPIDDGAWKIEIQSNPEKKRDYEIYRTWKTIDASFGWVSQEIIRPIEKEFKVNFSTDAVLLLKNKVAKDQLKSLISKQVPEPDYLLRDDQTTEQKRLDHLFRWYKSFELLDSSRSSIYNGVPAFVVSVVGAAEERRYRGSTRKIRVARIKHPVAVGKWGK